MNGKLCGKQLNGKYNNKPKQEKKEYIEKLNFVIEMDIDKGSQNEISNIISKRRARWLLSKTEDYFLE